MADESQKVSRGERPNGPRRWPRQAEGIRREALEIGEEIATLAKELRTGDLQRKPYLAERKAAEIETLGERIQKLMIKAQIGEE